MKAVEREGITTLAGVPPLWVQLTEAEWPPETAARMAALQNGEVDIVTNVPPDRADSIAREELTSAGLDQQSAHRLRCRPAGLGLGEPDRDRGGVQRIGTGVDDTGDGIVVIPSPASRQPAVALRQFPWRRCMRSRMSARFLS